MELYNTGSKTQDITSDTLSGVPRTDIVDGKNSITSPFCTNVSSLIPEIVHTEISISITGVQDFSSSLTFTVTAADGTTKDYTVSIMFGIPGTFGITLDGILSGVFSEIDLGILVLLYLDLLQPFPFRMPPSGVSFKWFINGKEQKYNILFNNIYQRLTYGRRSYNSLYLHI